MTKLSRPDLVPYHPHPDTDLVPCQPSSFSPHAHVQMASLATHHAHVPLYDDG